MFCCLGLRVNNRRISMIVIAMRGFMCWLRLDPSGRFAYVSMSDPHGSWTQIMTGTNLEQVAKRVQEKFGDEVWEDLIRVSRLHIMLKEQS